MADQPMALAAALVLALVAGAVGITLGIVVLAPGIRRALDRADDGDEEQGDRTD
jgi:hypothetical protein